MSSPIERLEAWCTKAASWDLANGLDTETWDSIIASYRAVVAEYRETEAEYDQSHDSYFEGAKHALLGVIATLAEVLTLRRRNNGR